jgi:hypothetical protein
MAIRDQEPSAEVRELRRGLPWRETLGYVPTLILLGGLLIYGYLSICYDRFYGSLGVDANDVGLSYTGTLARSSGFVIAYTLLIGWLAGGPLTTLPAAARHEREDPTSRVPRRMRLASIVFSLILLALTLSPPWLKAREASSDVQTGKPVAPIRFLLTPWSSRPLLPIPVLAIHADPAMVEPAGKPGESPAADRLRGRHLLYLGQAGGTVVFYDAAAQRAVYVPSSAVILHVVNCRGKPPPDPAC